MAEDERREEGRSSITLKVDYQRLNTFFADYTRNISKGGTFIRTDRPLAVGTRFVFVLSLPPAEPEGSAMTLELTGEVKWVVEEAAGTAEKPAGMGIQFVFASPEEKERVDALVVGLMHTSLGPHITGRLLAC